MTRTLLATVLLLVILAAGVSSFWLAGLPTPIARITGKLLSPPTGSARWVAWLEGDGGDARLMVYSGSGAPRSVLAASKLSGLAVSGGLAYTTRLHSPEESASGAALLRVDLDSGDAEVLADLAHPAAEMAWGEGTLCWSESRESRLPKAPFIVAAEPLAVIRACADSGADVTTIALVTGGSAGSRPTVRLLGVTGGDAYWVEQSGPRSGATTCVQRAPVRGGDAEIIVSEEGHQTAAIVDSMLIWTSHSVEAAEPRSMRAVKRASLDGTGAEVIADWLRADGYLLASRSGIYFQEKSRLWRLRGGRGEQRVLYERPHGIVAASAIGDEEYLATRPSGGIEVATRPLTWAARMRAMASP